MLDGVKNFSDFSNRATRKEYWLFYLLFIIACIFATIIDVMLGTISPTSGFGIVTIIVWLIFLLPAISVTVRRFHDQDMSGWYTLLGLIPGVGGLILLVFACLDGTKGENRFGPDPKGREAVAAAA